MRHTDVETRYIQDETLSMGNTEGQDTVEVRRDERGTEDETHSRRDTLRMRDTLTERRTEDVRHIHDETH